MRDQRYVVMNWETNVLTSNGVLDADAGRTLMGYGGAPNASGHSFDYSPAMHSNRWAGVSYFQTGIPHGVLWYEPHRSRAPYEVKYFNGPARPPAVPFGVIQKARLDPAGRPEQTPVREPRENASPIELRLPRTARRPCCEPVESIRLPVPEAQSEIAPQAPAGEVCAVDVEMIE